MMNGVDKYSTDNIADNEMIIAVDDVVKKDYDSAVVRIKKALARLKSTGHVEKYAEYLNILGLVYELENDESKAFECYLESLATAEIIRSRDLKAMVYSNIVQAIARWEEIRKRRDISTMPETNMTVPQKNLKNVIKAGSCLTI